jgi:hypothetical protein
MDDRIARLESNIADLCQLVALQQQRIVRLEQVVPAATRKPLPGSARHDEPAQPRRAQNDPIVILSLTGKLFLVVAGGFFLRALTESGVLPAAVGLAIGFGYAMAWLYFADRAGSRGDASVAFFHALGTALIAFPLLVEATTRFQVLSALSGAVAVALLATGLYAVACRRRLKAVAWIALAGTLATSGVLLAKTGAVAPFALLLVAQGVATLWIGYWLDWWGPRWPAALAADIAVVGVTLRVLAPAQEEAPLTAVLLQFTLFGAYVTSIAVRTLLQGRSVAAFEVVQAAAVLVVGFGGALYLTQTTGFGPAAIGWASLLLGVASYGIAVTFLDRHDARGPNLYYYTTLGLVHTVAGLALLLHAPWMATVLAALAVAAAMAWARVGRTFMLIHAAAYVAAAAFVSGALAYGLQTLETPGAGPWHYPTAAMAAVLIAAAMCARLASARRTATWAEVASALRLVIVLVLVGAGAACVIGVTGPLVAAAADGSLDAGVHATLTTVVLALAALVIAWIGRKPRYVEWAWLVYPLLVAIGVKMAMQDFKYSQPSTLFIAMAFYGAVLIFAPRLRRSSSTATAGWAVPALPPQGPTPDEPASIALPVDEPAAERSISNNS